MDFVILEDLQDQPALRTDLRRFVAGGREYGGLRDLA